MHGTATRSLLWLIVQVQYDVMATDTNPHLTIAHLKSNQMPGTSVKLPWQLPCVVHGWILHLQCQPVTCNGCDSHDHELPVCFGIRHSVSLINDHHLQSPNCFRRRKETKSKTDRHAVWEVAVPAASKLVLFPGCYCLAGRAAAHWDT